MIKNIISPAIHTILLFILLLLSGLGYAQDNSDTLLIPGYVKYKQIPTCIGEHCQSGQCYSPGVSDGPAASYLLHPDARIGKIKHCTMLCETPEGVCRKMIFTLHDEENVSKAGKQAAKQFGKPVYTKEGSLFVYAWEHTTADKQALSIKLEVSADFQSATMYVNGQE